MPLKFIRVLHAMVTLYTEEATRNDSDAIIKWSADGKSIVVVDADKLADQVLPKYFLHNRYVSFSRQMNAYGFKRPANGHVYVHPLFIRDKPELMSGIERQSEIELRTANLRTEVSTLQQKLDAARQTIHALRRAPVFISRSSADNVSVDEYVTAEADCASFCRFMNITREQFISLHGARMLIDTWFRAADCLRACDVSCAKAVVPSDSSMEQLKAVISDGMPTDVLEAAVVHINKKQRQMNIHE